MRKLTKNIQNRWWRKLLEKEIKGVRPHLKNVNIASVYIAYFDDDDDEWLWWRKYNNY